MLRGKWRAICGGVLVVIVLAGCAAPTAKATPTASESTGAGRGWSDRADAVGAITSFYRSYAREVDEVLHDGGRNPERLKPFLSDSLYADTLKSVEAVKVSRRHTKGETKIRSVKVQQADLAAMSASAYVCSDQTAVRVLDAGGRDVTPDGRVDQITLVIEVASVDRSLKVLASKTWSGDSVC